MTYNEFASFIRLSTQTTTTTLPNNEIMALANIFQEDIARDIDRIKSDQFVLMQQRDLVAGQRNYSLPADLLLNIDKVEVLLNGKWQEILPTDQTFYDGATDEESIKKAFSDTYKYDILTGSIYLLTGCDIEDVEDGIKIHASSYPQKIELDDFTDIPRSMIDISTPKDDRKTVLPKLFHRLLATKISIYYKQNRDRPLTLNEFENKYEYEYNLALTAIVKTNRKQSFIGEIPIDTGFDY